jgi:hypothetical protein
MVTELDLAHAVNRSWHTHDGYGNGYCIHCEASDGFDHAPDCIVPEVEQILGIERKERARFLKEAESNEMMGIW